MVYFLYGDVMNKKSGFTLIELLVVIIIIGLLLVIAIPSYLTVYGDVKRNTLSSKISEIENEALSYGSKLKDEIKENICITITIEELIKNGNLKSDRKNEDVIINPTDNTVLSGNILVCYDKTDTDIVAYYVEKYEKRHIYHKNDKVNIGFKVYKCLETINTKNYDINSLHQFSLIYSGE